MVGMLAGLYSRPCGAMGEVTQFSDIPTLTDEVSICTVESKLPIVMGRVGWRLGCDFNLKIPWAVVEFVMQRIVQPPDTSLNMLMYELGSIEGTGWVVQDGMMYAPAVMVGPL